MGQPSIDRNSVLPHGEEVVTKFIGRFWRPVFKAPVLGLKGFVGEGVWASLKAAQVKAFLQPDR